MLPIVVAGLVGFTYVFVNALPQAEVAGPGDTSAPTTTVTTTQVTSTTTRTTINPDAAAFIETTDTIERNVTDLSTLAQQINDSWDARDVEYGPTRDALEELETETATVAEGIAAIEVPSPATEDWAEVTANLEAMKTAAAGMVDGLVNAEGSEPRLTALEDYKAAVATVVRALGNVREAVRDPAA